MAALDPQGSDQGADCLPSIEESGAYLAPAAPPISLKATLSGQDPFLKCEPWRFGHPDRRNLYLRYTVTAKAHPANVNLNSGICCIRHDRGGA